MCELEAGVQFQKRGRIDGQEEARHRAPSCGHVKAAATGTPGLVGL